MENVRVIATYSLALLIVGACFVLIFTGRGDQTQAWASVGLVTGYILRDAGGAAATASVLKVQAAGPSVTTSAGPPQTTTVTPGGNGNA